LLLLFLFILSCSDDDCLNCPECEDCPDNSALFTVTVVDTLGNPVSLPEDSYVTLIIYDYYWNQVKILFDSAQFPATTVSVGWDSTDILNNPIKYGYYYAYLWTQ